MRPAGLALIVLTALGCEQDRSLNAAARTAARVGFDPDRARTALTSALDAWQKGQARGLPRQSPPIRFADDDLAAGWKLSSYELARPDESIEPLQDVPVILTLKAPAGQSVRREATYQVATTPGLAVMRSEP